jgi:hypothetical protein
MANGNPFLVPLRYKYQPVNYTAYAEPLVHHQQQYDKTLSALDETTYDIAHMTQDKELAKKMEEGLQGDLDKVSKDLLANADYKGAARKLSKLNKFYNNDDHMNAVRNSYANEQALIKELNEGIANEDWDEKYKQERLALERANFKGTTFNEGSYNIFNPGANYKDYTDEIKDEVEALLAKNPTEVQEYLKKQPLNAYQTRMMKKKIEQNDFQGLYDIAISTVTGNPKYAASIGHRAGLHYDYLGLNNPEWAAEKYGKDLAQFDEAIANAKNEEDRSTLRDNKARLQKNYEESQGDYYKSLYAQQMVDNMVRPIAANFTEYKQTLGSGFTYDNDPIKFAEAKAAAKARGKQKEENAGSNFVLNSNNLQSNNVEKDNTQATYLNNPLGTTTISIEDRAANATQNIINSRSDITKTNAERNKLLEKQTNFPDTFTEEDKVLLNTLNKTLIEQEANLVQGESGISQAQTNSLLNVEQDPELQNLSSEEKKVANELIELSKNMSPQEFMSFVSMPEDPDAVGVVNTIKNFFRGTSMGRIFTGPEEAEEAIRENNRAIQENVINKIKQSFNKQYTELNNDKVLKSNELTVSIVGGEDNAYLQSVPFMSAVLEDIKVQAGSGSGVLSLVERAETKSGIREAKYVDVENSNPLFISALEPQGIIGNTEDGMIFKYALKNPNNEDVVKAFLASESNKKETKKINDYVNNKYSDYNPATGTFNNTATQEKFNKWYKGTGDKGYRVRARGYNVNGMLTKAADDQFANIVSTRNINEVPDLATHLIVQNENVNKKYNTLAGTLAEKIEKSINGTLELNSEGTHIYTPKNSGNQYLTPSYEIIPGDAYTPTSLKLVSTSTETGDKIGERSINFLGSSSLNANMLLESELLTGTGTAASQGVDYGAQTGIVGIQDNIIIPLGKLPNL